MLYNEKTGFNLIWSNHLPSQPVGGVTIPWTSTTEGRSPDAFAMYSILFYASIDSAYQYYIEFGYGGFAQLKNCANVGIYGRELSINSDGFNIGRGYFYKYSDGSIIYIDNYLIPVQIRRII